MSCGPWIQPCCPPQEVCEDCHEHLTLTKHQDITNRTTLSESGQVLNVPPPLLARRDGFPVDQFVPALVLTPIGPLTTVHVDSSGGVMAPASPDDSIVIPRAGYYLVWGSVTTNDLDPGEWLQTRLQVNGAGSVGSGETVYGLGAGGFATSPVTHVPFQFFSQGDTIRVLALTNKVGGILVSLAYVGAQYLEYPVW
jgi:hypothetical protein